MGLNAPRAILFLDLDEVLITSVEKMAGHEVVVALHPAVVEELQPFFGQIIILTHRSRSEAMQILTMFPGLNNLVLQVVTADDVIRGALVTGQFLHLLRRGIEKRLFIRMAERKYGISPERMAILDDEPANVAGMLKSGVGLGLLAPKPDIADGNVTTFDMNNALIKFKEICCGEGTCSRFVTLSKDRQFLLADLPRTEVIYAQCMNRIRNYAKRMRIFLSATVKL